MKEPFFSGLVVLKEWKVLENCLRVWKKRSHSKGKTLVCGVLMNIQCFGPPERHRHCCRCAHKASAHMGTKGHSKTSRVLAKQGAPCCSAPAVAPYLLSCSWIHRIWFYCRNWGAEQAAKKRGGRWGVGAKAAYKRMVTPTYLFQRGKISFPSLMRVLFCSSSNVPPGQKMQKRTILEKSLRI